MGIERKRFATLGVASAAFLLPLSMSAIAQENDSGWTYTIAPYLWGTSIDGKVGTDGAQADISADFNDLVEFVDTAGAVRFEAIKQWGFYGDIWFTSLSSKEKTALGDIKASFDQTIAEVGALYAFRKDVTGYFGLRHQDVDGDITVPIAGKRSAGDNWTDAIVGMRYSPAFGERWFGVLRADVGAGDSDLTWLAQAGLGYRFDKRWSGQVAYRYLSTDFQKGGFKWDLAQEGVGLGLAYHF